MKYSKYPDVWISVFINHGIGIFSDQGPAKWFAYFSVHFRRSDNGMKTRLEAYHKILSPTDSLTFIPVIRLINISLSFR